MKHPKDETLSIRTSADIKQLLRMAAALLHKSGKCPSGRMTG